MIFLNRLAQNASLDQLGQIQFEFIDWQERQPGGQIMDEIRKLTAGGVRHGIFVVALSRMGKALPMQPDTVVQTGDLVSIFGAEQDVKRVAAIVGDVIVPSAKTDFVYLGAGLVVGLLVGLLSVKLGNINTVFSDSCFLGRDRC